jgi:predicted HAD superfamily Cof-like phosphohydrolase
MVREFHEEAGIPVQNETKYPLDKRVALRASLIREEYEETRLAMQRGTLEDIADGLADLIYVCCGTALEYGIPLDKVFEEVHRSNMTKLVDGTFRDDGKYLKGPSYEPPNLTEVMGLD